MENKKLGFIGIGNMAAAIIEGILSTNAVSPEHICMYNPHFEKMQRFAERGCVVCDSISALAAGCDVIFLCIKPQVFPAVFEELKPAVANKKASDVLFVSIAAGITFKNLRDALGSACGCVRAMPNTPLLLGEGATALCRTENVPDVSFREISRIFSCCGIVREIDEAQMNAVIAVSGSSPACLYRLAALTCGYAEQRGIDREAALELFCQTLKGSADMLLKSGKTPQALIDMVTSKGGTTFALLDVLDQKDFDGTMEAAFTACEKRAEELSI